MAKGPSGQAWPWGTKAHISPGPGRWLHCPPPHLARGSLLPGPTPSHTPAPRVTGTPPSLPGSLCPPRHPRLSLLHQKLESPPPPAPHVRLSSPTPAPILKQHQLLVPMRPSISPSGRGPGAPCPSSPPHHFSTGSGPRALTPGKARHYPQLQFQPQRTGVWGLRIREPDPTPSPELSWLRRWFRKSRLPEIPAEPRDPPDSLRPRLLESSRNKSDKHIPQQLPVQPCDGAGHDPPPHDGQGMRRTPLPKWPSDAGGPLIHSTTSAHGTPGRMAQAGIGQQARAPAPLSPPTSYGKGRC